MKYSVGSIQRNVGVGSVDKDPSLIGSLSLAKLGVCTSSGSSGPYEELV